MKQICPPIDLLLWKRKPNKQPLQHMHQISKRTEMRKKCWSLFYEMAQTPGAQILLNFISSLMPALLHSMQDEGTGSLHRSNLRLDLEILFLQHWNIPRTQMQSKILLKLARLFCSPTASAMSSGLKSSSGTSEHFSCYSLKADLLHVFTRNLSKTNTAIVCKLKLSNHLQLALPTNS